MSSIRIRISNRAKTMIKHKTPPYNKGGEFFYVVKKVFCAVLGSTVACDARITDWLTN